MTGIIILAAGSSSRLGSPKQNLVYQGKTLLQRSIASAIASVCAPIIVVLGAKSASISPSIEKYNINIIQNADWAEGMASSIRAGVSELKRINPEAESVILMLCDQPFVDTYLLNLLIMAKPRTGITACFYNDTPGPPVLFDALYFDDLLSLTGNEGAKKIIMKHPHAVIYVPFPEGSIDIDTIADYEKINANSA